MEKQRSVARNHLFTLSDNPHIITISEPKERAKLPSFLVNTMQKRGHMRCSDETNSNEKKATKDRSFLPKKIGSIIFNAFSRRKEQEKWYSEDETIRCMEDKERLIGSKMKVRSIKIPQKITLLKAFEAKEENERTKEQNWKQSGENVSIRLSRLFNKSTGSHVRRWTLIKEGNGINCTDEALNSVNLSNANIVPLVQSRYGRARSVKCAPENMMKGKEKSEHKGESKGKENGTRELELCKKRILMGGKCRPMNLSGALHYDKDGVLLPEEIL